MLSKLLGYIGAVCLALCALPLMLTTIRAGHANGIDGSFLALWLAGEMTMLAHVLETRATLPVRLNYIANVMMVGVIGCYRWL